MAGRRASPAWTYDVDWPAAAAWVHRASKVVLARVDYARQHVERPRPRSARRARRGAQDGRRIARPQRAADALGDALRHLHDWITTGRTTRSARRARATRRGRPTRRTATRGRRRRQPRPRRRRRPPPRAHERARAFALARLADARPGRGEHAAGDGGVRHPLTRLAATRPMAAATSSTNAALPFYDTLLCYLYARRRARTPTSLATAPIIRTVVCDDECVFQPLCAPPPMSKFRASRGARRLPLGDARVRHRVQHGQRARRARHAGPASTLTATPWGIILRIAEGPTQLPT